MGLELNNEIKAFIDYKDFKGDRYSDEDIAYIQQYTGAGGKAEKGSNDVGMLSEFFTPDYICDYMYQLAVKYGYNKGNILEPSCGTGRIIKPFYDNNNFKNIVAIESNTYSKRITELTYPEAIVLNMYFEKAFLEPTRYTSPIPKNKVTWLEQYPFDLVIGNPPYGVHRNRYSSYFKGKDRFKQIETFFIYKGMQMLKKGGLLVYITSSNFMRTGGSNWKEKETISTITEFVDAYRLPKVFKNTAVGTDILIFRRK